MHHLIKSSFPIRSANLKTTIEDPDFCRQSCEYPSKALHRNRGPPDMHTVHVATHLTTRGPSALPNMSDPRVRIQGKELGLQGACSLFSVGWELNLLQRPFCLHMGERTCIISKQRPLFCTDVARNDDPSPVVWIAT